jgi:hypothetical protein
MKTWMIYYMCVPVRWLQWENKKANTECWWGRQGTSLCIVWESMSLPFWKIVGHFPWSLNPSFPPWPSKWNFGLFSQKDESWWPHKLCVRMVWTLLFVVASTLMSFSDLYTLWPSVSGNGHLQWKVTDDGFTQLLGHSSRELK